MREWRSGNVGAFQVHVESSILSSRTKLTTPSIDSSMLGAVFCVCVLMPSCAKSRQ